jgi:hypothetical protein
VLPPDAANVAEYATFAEPEGRDVVVTASELNFGVLFADDFSVPASAGNIPQPVENTST